MKTRIINSYGARWIHFINSQKIYPQFLLKFKFDLTRIRLKHRIKLKRTSNSGLGRVSFFETGISLISLSFHISFFSINFFFFLWFFSCLFAKYFSFYFCVRFSYLFLSLVNRISKNRISVKKL